VAPRPPHPDQPAPLADAAAAPAGAARRSWLRRRWPLLYLVALGASALVQTLVEPGKADDPELTPAATLTVAAMGDEGPEPGEHEIAYRAWQAGEPSPRGTMPLPVLMIHGSPGDSSNFEELGRELAARGWPVIAPDLPGFGLSRGEAPSYSSLAQARSMAALLGGLGVERAHVVGWSNGGAVGLWMADLEPERIASLTLLAGTGAQYTEGSGSYFFEHVKYGVGLAVLVGGAELVPHFGLLGSRQARWAFLRNFWDSDQRPLEEVMRRLQTPTLILHGRDDFLVAPWAAQEHHRLIGSSRLVIFDADHFMPMLAPDETAGHLAPFLSRHDEPGAAPLVQVSDLAPRPQREGVAGKVERAAGGLHRVPWWVEALGLGLLALVSRWLALGAAGYLVSMMALDLGVASVAFLIGAGARSALQRWPAFRDRTWRRWFKLRTMGRVAGRTLWLLVRALVALTVLAAMGWLLLDPILDGLGSGGLALWLAVAPAVVVGGRSVVMWGAWGSRQRLKARISRVWRHEFWPWYIYYAPLAPWLVWLGVRYRGLMTFTCVNPALGPGGGVIGESKSDILNAMGDDPAVLAHELLPAGPAPAARLGRLEAALQARPELGGWPIILKPDRGERGYAVRLCRGPADALAYLERMGQDVIAQRYHPGPQECSVLWVREEGAPSGGAIFSITRKEFQTVTGDGRRTLRALILADQRLRMQADLFLRRFADQAGRVLAAGETLRMSESGNHAQGTLFRDGADLATEELAERIGAIVAGIEAEGGGPGFDFGRLDIRYSSDEELRRGEGLAIVELNGATSESTNMYDPARSLVWAWGVLLRQWRAVYRLGAARRGEGASPMGVRELVGLLARERGQRGEALPSS
jgi:pimeloyl-ACP methyl ester carboxylesterase